MRQMSQTHTERRSARRPRPDRSVAAKPIALPLIFRAAPMVGDNFEQELTIVNLSQSVPGVPEKNHPRETSRVA
jgi:hypothetical protein